MYVCMYGVRQDASERRPVIVTLVEESFHSFGRAETDQGRKDEIQKQLSHDRPSERSWVHHLIQSWDFCSDPWLRRVAGEEKPRHVYFLLTINPLTFWISTYIHDFAFRVRT